MRNRLVGYIIIGFALIMAFIILTYHNTLIDIGAETCTVAAPECPHLKESNQQLRMNLIILSIIVLIGVYLIFFSQEERIVTKIKKITSQVQPKKLTKDNYKKISESLSSEEKKVLDLLIEHEGSVFQSEIVSKISLTKVKVTRILDRLEGRGLIERKRRGMTNVVILKH